MKNIKAMNRILQVLKILFSALMLFLAIPNNIYYFGSPLIAFFALVPFYSVFTKEKNYLWSAIDFAILTFFTQLFSSYWLGFFKEFAFVTLFFTCFGTSLEGFAAGLFLHIPFERTKRTNVLRVKESDLYSSFVPMRILYFSIVYTLYEWIKSVGFLGYPWGTVSMALFRFKPLIQIADITGTYGITFITVMFSCVFYELYDFFTSSFSFKNIFKKRGFYSFLKKRPLYNPLKEISIVWILLFASSLVYGFYQCGKKRNAIKYLNTIFVQQNKDPWKIENDSDTINLSERLTEEKLNEAKENGENVDLVVWSEGCLKRSFPNARFHYENYPRNAPLKEFVKNANVPFIFGGSYVINESPRESVNATILYDEKGEFRGYYGKLHLVPFAEVIPFAEYPKVASFLRNKLGISPGWHPGLQYVFYDIKGEHPEEKVTSSVNIISLSNSIEEQIQKENEKPLIRISTPICYDDAFPDVCTPLFNNGSEIFMNLTDDSWSKKESSEYQHFVVSSFRAIEMRTTLARSTNSGFTSVVSPTGNILFSLPLFKECSGFFKIPIYERKQTVYAKLGNWIPHIFLIFVIAVGFSEWLLKDKRAEVSSERKKFRKSKKKKNKGKKKSKKK